MTSVNLLLSAAHAAKILRIPDMDCCS